MRRISTLAIAVVFAMAAAPAGADTTGGMPGIPSSARVLDAPVPGGTPQSAGGTDNRQTLRPSRGVKKRVRRHVVKTCRTRHHRRVCRYRVGRQVIKVCTKRRHHRRHCHARASAAAQPAARARIASRLNSGFVTQPLGAVVRIYWHAKSGYTNFCSGTMLTRGLILTAGHCVYSNDADGRPENGYSGYYAPGTYTIVPGNTVRDGTPTAPYGQWSVHNMWTTQDYADGILGGDWGIIETDPNASGQYPGDVVGTFAAYWDQHFAQGAELYLTGYPASGAFTLSQYGAGNLQYFCDETWDNTRLAHPSFGDAYYGMDFAPCEMNGGASGGPVFLRAGASDWRIVGVNNRGGSVGTGTDAVGGDMMSFWLDDTFGSFWSTVVGLVNQGQ